MQAQLGQKAIPPTYAPPRPPPEGKPLTNRQKAALAFTFIMIFVILVLLGLIVQGRL